MVHAQDTARVYASHVGVVRLCCAQAAVCAQAEVGARNNILHLRMGRQLEGDHTIRQEQGIQIMKPQSVVKHGRVPRASGSRPGNESGFHGRAGQRSGTDTERGRFPVSPPMPPGNDNFDNATSITSLPFAQAVDAALATTESGEPQYCYSSAQTVWYKLTLDHSAWVVVSHSGNANSSLTVYRVHGPGFGGLFQVTCNGYNSNVTFQADAGATYYFQQGTMYGTGSLTIDIQEPPRPRNDDFANASQIQGVPYDDSMTIAYATAQTGEQRSSCTPEYTFKTVWYVYTPASSGSFMASTSGDWYEGFLAIWTRQPTW